jgi:uncharacterized membrane protein
LPGASGSSAVSINHAGQAVGNSAFGGETFAPEWSGGSILKLEGPSQTTATGINDAGQVVGTSFFIGPYFATATDWIGGSAVYLQNLPGATESVAFGINNAGQVVGESFIGGIGVATEWSGGSVITLGSGLANSINDAGQAVGVGSLNTATEWSGGSVINLTNLPGTIASTAYDINDAGLVVGSSFIEGALYATE